MKKRMMLTGLLVACALSLLWVEEAAAAPTAKGYLVLKVSPAAYSSSTVISVYSYAGGPSPSAIYRGFLAGKKLSLKPGYYYISGASGYWSDTIDRIQVIANRTTSGTLFLKNTAAPSYGYLKVTITPSRYASQTTITAYGNNGQIYALRPGVAAKMLSGSYAVEAVRMVNGVTYGSAVNVTVKANNNIQTIMMSVSSPLGG